MSNQKPNIVFILTDDQGAWAMRCSGNQDVITPNLDRLAENGVMMTNFFCTSPVCSPARASILTGRMPSRHGVHDWIRSGNLEYTKLDEEKQKDAYFRYEKMPTRYLDGMLTYTDVLAKHGYTCALSGKWHLGDTMNPQHGFSHWFTIGMGGCYYMHPDLVEDGKLRYDNRYVTDVITDKAISYIEELSTKEAPYYLSVHYTAPHSPWDKSEHLKEDWDLYENCKFLETPDLPIHPWQISSAPYGVGEERKNLLRGYYTAITAMDRGIGKMIDAIEKTGKLDNTILVFMADNGMNMGHHGIWGKGNGTFPFNLYDTAVKVPFIISYPRHLPKGVVSEAMQSQYDWMPTLLDLVGIEEEMPEKLPGRSFKKVLEGDENEKGSVVVYDEYGANRMIRTKEWKFIRRYPYGPNELYHLADDPEELVNLINDEQYRDIREELQNRMTAWFLEYTDPKMDGVKEAVTGFGQLCRSGVYSNGEETYASE